MINFWNALMRRKTNDVMEPGSKLARVLNVFDLTALGVSGTLGMGVYVVADSVAYNIAEPAVIISFLIVDVASVIARIYYAEYAARVSKAGGAYMYSYMTIGEFVAFTIGWNLMLEFMIGVASLARGMSGYLDSLLDKNMSKTLNETMSINVDILGEYPDFLAFGMILLLTVLLASSVKESSLLNNIFTSVNIITILIVIIADSIKANFSSSFGTFIAKFV